LAEIAIVPLQHTVYDRDSTHRLRRRRNGRAPATHAGTNHPCAQLDWTMIKAFNKLGLDPSIDASEIEDLSEDMQAAMEMLS
jgi:hypothetical protein